MPGFPREIFTDAEAFHDRLLCVICKLILRWAVQSTCGHRYCEVCVKDRLASRSNAESPRAIAACPACPADSDDAILNENEIYPDFHARKELKMLKVKCRNDGCTWEGKFCVYEKHNSECSKIEVTCGDCRLKMPRDTLASHQDSEVDTCPNMTRSCPYAELGCTYKCRDSLMRDHIEKEIVYHTKLQIDWFNEKVAQVNGMFESLTIWEPRLAADGEASAISGEGKCANPHTSAGDFTQEKIDQTISQLKNVFIVRSESGPTKETMKSKLVPQTGQSLKQGTQEAVDSIIKDLEYDKVKEREQELHHLRDRYAVLVNRNESFQEDVAVLNNQMEALAERANTLERENRHLQDIIEQREKQINAHDQMLTVKNVALAEQELRIQSLEASAYNGILVWKISEFARRRRDAVSGKTTSFYSPAFYTSYHGYKMCARIYLNGDGVGKGTHISLFFVVMKGRYDNILRWPFRQKVTFMMVDQGNREHVVDSFRPDPRSSSFKKPTHEMNIASGCHLFVNLNLLESENHSFVKDDCLFVKVIVDVSDLERI